MQIIESELERSHWLYRCSNTCTIAYSPWARSSLFRLEGASKPLRVQLCDACLADCQSVSLNYTMYVSLTRARSMHINGTSARLLTSYCNKLHCRVRRLYTCPNTPVTYQLAIHFRTNCEHRPKLTQLLLFGCHSVLTGTL